MSSANLRAAAKAKADEFYTQLEDIERELKHYRAFFSGKVVYCNCDCQQSNFVRYFREHFDDLGLKGLLVSGFEITPHGVDKSVGDFRSAECIELLKEADVVVTNPPFSLFREYVAQLIQFNKKFVILGNVNAITYKEIFPLIQQNKMWLGISIHSGDREMRVPDHYEIRTKSLRVDETGIRYIRVPSLRWYTNIPLKKYKEELLLVFSYYENPEKYPKYDNYDAIEVSKTAQIPYDYFGVMGVPITFMDKYNPEQFELLGVLQHGKICGRQTYKRLLIRRKPLQRQGLF